MSGVEVTCRDLDSGESESKVIDNDYLLVTVGNHFLDRIDKHGNGTVILTIKVDRP